MVVKLIVFAGLSGAGKTTAAQAECEKQPYFHICAYDDVRQRFPKFSAAEVTMHLITEAAWHLLLGSCVIVDACNTHPHDYIRWETVAAVVKAEFEWRWLETSLETCVERDARRQVPVGMDTIFRQEEMRHYLDRLG